MQPYGKLEELGSGLWIRDGEWYGTAFQRRMTIMKLSNGALAIHNPFVLTDEDALQLKSMGKIAAILVPNTFHGDDAGWMANQYPEARVFVPAALYARIRRKHRVDGTFEENWPSEWLSSIECLPVQGLRLLYEVAFFHKPSRTLVLTDLVFNMRAKDFKGKIERKLMAWNRVGTGFGPSRLCDNVFTRDKSARLSSVETMLSWDFDRIVMNHGQIVESGGKKLLRTSFAEIPE